MFKIKRRVQVVGVHGKQCRQDGFDFRDWGSSLRLIFIKKCQKSNVDLTPNIKGYYQAIGTSGNQFKTAPVAGGMMAELIDKVENGYDHDAAPLRYKLPHLGLTVDMSCFHRNRTINRDGSFSVMG